ncbi:hypothetical protein [Halorussus aquaticus]|uniref:Uncharacterized protein n=1 Tax=Halorussus aquaticus TaxID=2953748 RepID=A0ABD5Q0T9_9EURY|nr:hypothetical protein [Halorussus aquaticus]
MENSDTFSFAMMVLVCSVALFVYADTQDDGVRRAATFAVVTSTVVMAGFGYRIGKDTT